MSVLAVEHLSVAYGMTTAVSEISFAIEPGEVVALVGESGSGKSSAALALTRLLPEAAEVSGQVFMDNRNLLDVSEEELRRVRGGSISYVFQEPSTSLNPVLTIGEQLREAIELHTGARGRKATRCATDWLRHVGMTRAQARLRAYPHEFSGGMQQRVMIAMALATEPTLLVADEPTTALDVTVQVQILRLLRDLQRDLKLSVLLISHDLLVVERIAHRVGVMSKGRLVELGATAQMLKQPKHPVTQQLLRARATFQLPS